MNHEHEDWQEPLNEDDDLGDTPEFVEETELTEEQPSPEEAGEFFSDPSNMEDFAAQQHATALGKAAEARAKEIYAQQEEEKRRQSPNRAKPSFEVFNEKERYWEKPENKD